jgi:FAD/FMN-containing dehydrogenase
VGHRAEADRRRSAHDWRRAGGQRARTRPDDEADHRRRGVVRLIDAQGRARTCSRSENADLFKLAIGGYGLFGPIATVRLRLIPRQKIRRVVEVRTIEELPAAFEQRIADGFQFGDFQFSIDEASDDFLRRGVFSCYKPVDAATPMPEAQKELGDSDWQRLLLAAHASKAEAFRQYSQYYLSTNGQLYWSDTHQLGAYTDDYHKALDKGLGSKDPATEMITEIYVPRLRLPDFMNEVARTFRSNGVPIIYGTIRLIEKDDESVLAWAKEPYACIIFNLHVVHTPAGHGPGRRGVPQPHSDGHRARRAVLPDVSPVREPRTGRGLLPAAPSIPPPEEDARSGRALPERLVPVLPHDVRRHAVMPASRRYAFALWTLFGLFVVRVAAQLSIALGGGSFLPPWEEWFSGALGYPPLLASQIVIILVFATIAVDVTRGRGVFAVPRRAAAVALLTVGSVYLVVMALRYAIRMTLYPPERWAGGSIPIFFHWVLAGFILVLGFYHRRFAPAASSSLHPMPCARSPVGRRAVDRVRASAVLWRTSLRRCCWPGCWAPGPLNTRSASNGAWR